VEDKPMESVFVPISEYNKLKKAFTIIECMVVVAIIALVVAILIPALSTAKNATQGVSSDSETPPGNVVLQSNDEGEYLVLPLTATDIIEHGNGWYEFTLNGNRWLYHNDGYEQESLTFIPPQTWNE
jgi:prepilin-type N-terminal cleavage/methylation domain-containing protein